MKNLAYITAIFLLLLTSSMGIILSAPGETEAKASLSFEPHQVMQGEPLEIIVKGLKKSEKIQSVTFASTTVPMTSYNKAYIGFVPVDLNKKVGSYTIYATIINPPNKNLKVLEKEVEVIARPKKEAPLGIPQKLGGNTAASQKQLVDTLAQENQSLLNLGTAASSYWKKGFIYPVKNPIVTDAYGYSRLTGAYTITHKGTDFRAPTGTEVFAVNDGVVKLARYGRNYGNTLVIDHGNGVQSFYMHLSHMNVSVGDKVS